MAEYWLPKPTTRVRFPSPAPKQKEKCIRLFFFYNRVQPKSFSFDEDGNS